MKENKILILIELIINFLKSIFESLGLLLSTIVGRNKGKGLKANRFLDVLNFAAHTGPKRFWKKPSGIEIGRGISTFLHYVFEKDQVFKETKKFDK